MPLVSLIAFACILEVPGFKSCPTDCPFWCDICGFAQPVQENVDVMPQIGPVPHHFCHFVIHQS